MGIYKNNKSHPLAPRRQIILLGRRSDFYSRRDCAGVPPACSPFKPSVTWGHPGHHYYSVGQKYSRPKKKVNAPPPPTAEGISDYLIQGRTAEILPRIVQAVKKLSRW